MSRENSPPSQAQERRLRSLPIIPPSQPPPDSHTGSRPDDLLSTHSCQSLSSSTSASGRLTNVETEPPTQPQGRRSNNLPITPLRRSLSEAPAGSRPHGLPLVASASGQYLLTSAFTSESGGPTTVEMNSPTQPLHSTSSSQFLSDAFGGQTPAGARPPGLPLATSGQSHSSSASTSASLTTILMESPTQPQLRRRRLPTAPLSQPLSDAPARSRPPGLLTTSSGRSLSSLAFSSDGPTYAQHLSGLPIHDAEPSSEGLAPLRATDGREPSLLPPYHMDAPEIDKTIAMCSAINRIEDTLRDKIAEDRIISGNLRRQILAFHDLLSGTDRQVSTISCHFDKPGLDRRTDDWLGIFKSAMDRAFASLKAATLGIAKGEANDMDQHTSDQFDIFKSTVDHEFASLRSALLPGIGLEAPVLSERQKEKQRAVIERE